jgi:hypothetical protein
MRIAVLVLVFMALCSPAFAQSAPLGPGGQGAGGGGGSGGYSYKNITTDTTTVVKSAAGLLHTVTINTPVSGGTVTIYDNTAGSGTKIGTFTVPTAATPITLIYDVAFLTGLTIVSGVQVMDITISYQ